jgi:hypothetical protein
MSTRRRYDFVTLVQTIVLHQRPPLEIAISIVEAATFLPDEAIPTTSLRDAAFQLWQWKMGKDAKPKFMQEFEEAAKAAEKKKLDAVVISVNHEAECDTWWMTAEGFVDGLPKSCLEIVCGRGVSRITVSREDAEAFRDWGAGIHGWHDGPPFFFWKADGTPAFE